MPVILALVMLVSLRAFASETVSGRVIKVLPLFLDTNGVDAISPSLFDRDAYQAELRKHPEQVSAMRFDVWWSANDATNQLLKLRAELRGVAPDAHPRLTTLETNLLPKTFRHWTSLQFGGADYKDFGTVVAWRVTLWDGDKLLGEQKSFLW
ncbi:MAG: hypothetical protein ACLQSR_05395 [Limisphaerales bacterium]